MGWEFAALLVGALVLSILLSLWQNRVYLREVNKLARAHAGKDLRLVTGQGKGRLSGAIVILVVDLAKRTVVDARVLAGATIFNRPRPAPFLQGGLDDVVDRATSKHLRVAIEGALKLLPAGTVALGAASPEVTSGRVKIRAPHRNEEK